MKIQTKSKQPKPRLTASFQSLINREIEREAIRYDCSKSFVIANCVGFALNIPIKETYKNAKR